MRFRLHRHKTDFPVTISTPNGPVPATMRDVNTSGALLLTDRLLEKEQKVIMSIKGQKLAGRVRWSNSTAFGMRFNVPLSPITLDWLRKTKVAQRHHVRFSSVGMRELS